MFLSGKTLKICFFQGFETIASSLSILSLHLAFYPEVQDKIFDELQTVFSSEDEEVTEEHLKQLIYLDLVMKEVMRLWPSSPFMVRRLGKDMKLGKESPIDETFHGLDISDIHITGEFTVPEGCNVIIPMIHIHRNKALWGDDADEFKPERFLPENFKNIHPYAYLPYSKGPRNCVGIKYAQQSLTVILAHFFRRFKTRTTLKLDELKYEYMIVIKVVQGANVSLEKRDFKAKRRSEEKK
jgi:cytochrome P450